MCSVQLEESKAYYHLSNLTKARTAFTSARTVASSKYVPVKTQVSGILTFKTESVKLRLLLTCNQEFFTQPMKRTSRQLSHNDSVNETTEAMRALKYMSLCKVSILLVKLHFQSIFQ